MHWVQSGGVKKPWCLQPLGFLALGLASYVALGLPSENPSGGLQSSPRAQIEFSPDRPRAQIQMATWAFPQIVPGSGLQTVFRFLMELCKVAVWPPVSTKLIHPVTCRLAVSCSGLVLHICSRGSPGVLECL